MNAKFRPLLSSEGALRRLRDADVSRKTNMSSRPQMLSPHIPERFYGTDTMHARPLHITILDDDLSVRTAIRRLLKTSEIDVDLHATSMELFSALGDHSPDCLILDLQMPGMNGVEVMNYLSHIGVHIPTVVITAHDEPGSRETCLAAGASAYLRKPLDADELLVAIDNAISASPAR
jgi:FixJ family two-component response regulator